MSTVCLPLDYSEDLENLAATVTGWGNTKVKTFPHFLLELLLQNFQNDLILGLSIIGYLQHSGYRFLIVYLK